MAILVADICGKYQELVDYHKMASQAQGVIIQMTYGTLLTPLAKENQAASKGVIPRWFYQYFYTEYSPTQQASAFVSAMNGDYGLGLWIDVEEPSVPFSQFQCDQLHLMLTEVERLSGIRPGVYSGEWFADPYLKLATFLADYPLWTANYPAVWNPTMPPAPIIPNLWKGKPWTLWQYTDNGDAAAHGCAGTGLDLSVWNGDEVAWQAYIGVQPARRIRITGADGATGTFVEPITTEAV